MVKKEFNRKEYDKVRKMDHNAMKEYIERKYNQGFVDGLTKAQGEIKEAVANIRKLPGIGEKKMKQIEDCMAAVGGAENG